MLEYIFLGIVLLLSLYASFNWYRGMWLILAVGFFQDPVRKMISDQPAYMVVLVAVVFFAVIFGLFNRGFSFRPSVVPGWRNGVATAVMAFVTYLFLQLLNAYLNFGSLMLVGLGVLAYISPLLAIFGGYYFACRRGVLGIDRFLTVYCLFCVAFSAGIYLEYFGIDSSALGEVGAGITIYDLGTILNAYSGFFRSSELAAWHIFCGSSMMLILLLKSSSNLTRILWFLAIIFVVTAGLLTGRRKMLVSILVFGSVYWTLTMVYLNQTLKTTAVLFLLGMASLWALSQNEIFSGNEGEAFELYVERSSGVFGDIGKRVEVLGIATVTSAVKEYGLFGKGAGAFSQGARFTGDAIQSAWQTEGGLGRIVVELGLVGLILLLWMSWQILLQFRLSLLYLARKDTILAQSCIGLISFLIANFSNFFIASQVFGDPFVLVIIGLITGFVVSFPMQSFLQDYRRQKAWIPAFA